MREDIFKNPYTPQEVSHMTLERKEALASLAREMKELKLSDIELQEIVKMAQNRKEITH
jgi:hypothetical protein